MERRSLLRAVGVGALMAGLSAGSLVAQDDLTELRVQLGWIANVEYGDHWIALEDGLFEAEGLDVTVTPGGPNAPDPLTLVAAGSTDIGYTSWLPFLDAVAMGNDYVMIAARMQSSPLGIISLAERPILTPEDIIGSRILAQGPAEETAIQATLGLAELDPEDWEMVPAGFSPEPLVAGDGDGYTAFATNQTITLEQMGLERDEDFFFRSFDELGFPSYAGIVFVERSFLEENRPALVAYLRALIQAWEINETDLTYAPTLAVETYGADYGLDLEQQVRQNELQMPFWRPEGDSDYRLLSLDLEKIGGPMYEAARATGRTELPDVEQIVDTSLVEEALDSL